MAFRWLMQIFWTLPTLLLGCLYSWTTSPVSGTALPLLTFKWKAPRVYLIWAIPSLCSTYKDIALVCFLPFAHSPAGAQLVEQDISGQLSCSLQVYQKIIAIPRNTIISLDCFFNLTGTGYEQREEGNGIYRFFTLQRPELQNLSCAEDTCAMMPWSWYSKSNGPSAILAL